MYCIIQPDFNLDLCCHQKLLFLTYRLLPFDFASHKDSSTVDNIDQTDLVVFLTGFGAIFLDIPASSQKPELLKTKAITTLGLFGISPCFNLGL